MSRKPIPVLALAVLCALVLVAAGCGGKKKSASPATNAASTTTAATTQEATTDSTDTGSTDTTSNNGSSSKDCQEFASAASKIGQDFSEAVSGTNANIDKAAKEFDELTAKAPDEIKPDFQTIDDAFKKLAGAFNNGKPDVQKLQKISSEINQTKLQQAAQNISAWAQKNCSH